MSEEDGFILWLPPENLAKAGTLAVKVRSLSGALVANGISGQPIELPEGEYVVSALMPNGHEVMADQPTQVIFGKTESPTITVQDDVVAAEASSRANLSALQASNDYAMAGPVAVETGRQVAAQNWVGSWLGEWADAKTAMKEGLALGTNMYPEPLILSESVQTLLRADEEHDHFIITRHIIHFDEEDGAQAILRFSIVPHDQCIVCIGEEKETPMIRATIREGSDPPSIKYASEASDEANALLNYVEAGGLSAMQAVSATFINQGETAILQAQVSLLRGVTGAYVMLRANAVEGLESFLTQLGDLAPCLPDTYVLQGELLARLGRHKEAAHSICKATEALCPWFRSGITFLFERTRLYLELKDAQKASLELSDENWQRLAKAKARLQRMMPMLVESQLFTTFDIPE
jgi:hypothetical protein